MKINNNVLHQTLDMDALRRSSSPIVPVDQGVLAGALPGIQKQETNDSGQTSLEMLRDSQNGVKKILEEYKLDILVATPKIESPPFSITFESSMISMEVNLKNGQKRTIILDYRRAELRTDKGKGSKKDLDLFEKVYNAYTKYDHEKIEYKGKKK